MTNDTVMTIENSTPRFRCRGGPGEAHQGPLRLAMPAGPMFVQILGSRPRSGQFCFCCFAFMNSPKQLVPYAMWSSPAGQHLGAEDHAQIAPPASFPGIVGTRIPRCAFFGETVQFVEAIDSSGPPGCLYISETAFGQLTPHFIQQHGARVVDQGMCKAQESRILSAGVPRSRTSSFAQGALWTSEVTGSRDMRIGGAGPGVQLISQHGDLPRESKRVLQAELARLHKAFPPPSALLETQIAKFHGGGRWEISGGVGFVFSGLGAAPTYAVLQNGGLETSVGTRPMF